MHYLEHRFLCNIIRYGSVVVFGFIMILLSQLTGLHEFMFPEGISVVLGVWAIERQPWRVNKTQLFFMMIIGSICAVCIVRYLPIPLIFQVLIGFILVGISLLVTKTSFAPVVSAFMLPILLQSDSWLFPLLVIGYIGIIIAVQTLYQKIGLTKKTVSAHAAFQWKNELFHWCILLIIFSVLSIYPTVTHSIYFMVPPLIITFVEMAEPFFLLAAQVPDALSDPAQALLAILIGGGVGDAQVIFAVAAEFHAGNRCHAVLLQQQLGKGEAVHAEFADVREQIEGCLGPAAGDSQLLQAVIQQQPAAVEFPQHLVQTVLGTLQSVGFFQHAPDAGKGHPLHLCGFDITHLRHTSFSGYAFSLFRYLPHVFRIILQHR